MENAIVTGANGFIGSAVVKELVQNGIKVTAIVHANNSQNIQTLNGVTIVSCDLENIINLKSLLPNVDYDIFYHLAWAGSAGALRSDTLLQLRNAQWTINALECAKEVGCKRFICAGSIMEHETIAAAYTQGNKPGAGYIYGGGKVVAHIMGMSKAVQVGMDIVWASITNAYGVGEKSPRLVNSTIKKCLQGIEPEFTSGMQNYDFVYIDDVARAFRLIGEKGKAFHEYLIGSGHARPLKEFLLEMQKAIAPNLNFKFGNIPFTGINLPLSDFDCSLTERDTGFKSEISFCDGCKRTADWWRKEINDGSEI